MIKLKNLYKRSQSYHMVFLSLLGIILGGVVGIHWGGKTIILQPLADLFLHLLFTLVVPLVFFSISAAITQTHQPTKLWRLFSQLCCLFLITGLIAALVMLIALLIWPLPTFVSEINLPPLIQDNIIHSHFLTSLVNLFTVSSFTQLFNLDHLLALVVFSVLIGLATVYGGDKTKPFTGFLQGGAAVSMRTISIVMYYAPIGFFAYFAIMAGQLGQGLLGTYAKITAYYYLMATFYFIVFLTLYAWLGDPKQGIQRFWRHIIYPGATALATCSSAASIPANLHATDKMGIAPPLYELSIPFGGIINKQGSVLGGMIKIAFLFSLYHLPFTGIETWILALFISVLVGTVMGAIPSGGMIGEMLIISVYHFPPSSLVMIAAISLLIDPPATVLNVTANTACTLLASRFYKNI